MPHKLLNYLEVGRALRSARSTEAALGLLTEAAQAVTKSAQATVRLIDPAGRDLLVAARTGEEMHVGGPGHFRTGEGLVGWCAKQGRAARVNDVTTDSRFQSRGGHVWTPSGILVAPLLLGSDEVIGVLSAARHGGPAYGAGELHALELLAELAAPHVQVAQLRELADTDPLTRLFNRRHLRDRFASALESASRHGRNLSIILLDVDHFGSVNKKHGLNVGDEVLIEMALRMRHACRTADVLFRWGGEEFLFLLPETDAAQALQAADRVLASLRSSAFATTAGPLTVRASAGVCEVHATDSLLTAQGRADERLHRAKLGGRDRAVGRPEPSDGPDDAQERPPECDSLLLCGGA